MSVRDRLLERGLLARKDDGTTTLTPAGLAYCDEVVASRKMIVDDPTRKAKGIKWNLKR